ncbi:hypothetical protein C0580_00855 [Candidatus Parcubacteria bacterium]|nr:MAG: hypothetical protein C0580_00855 [Candidatus Parcubacteria bacterium]
MPEENNNFINNPDPVPNNQGALNDVAMTNNQIANKGVPPEDGNPVNPQMEEKSLPPQKNSQKEVFGKSEMLNAGTILKDVLGISVGSMVADLGAGGGMFSIQSARLVGDQGQVYAVDILKNTLSEIESKARMAGLYNIKTIWSNLEVVGATKINEGTLDFTLLVNVLFQSTKHYEMMAEAARLLKPGGKLLIIDWDNTKPAFTPPSNMQVEPTKLNEYAHQLDLNLVKDFKAGQYHFGIIFSKVQ